MRSYVLSTTILILWWVVVAFGLKAITLDTGELPVDYRTYERAAELLRATGSPYPDPSSAQETWRSMHQSALAVFRPNEAAIGNAQVVSGPYLYPPSLALALVQSGISAAQYLTILTAATIALCIGWLRLSADRSLFWLLPMAGSIDLIAIFLGGNIEILLIALSLVACAMIWRDRVVWASPLIAAVILVKPQFILLFLAFGCFWAFTRASMRSVIPRGLTMVALVTVLIILEVQRWPEAARADFFDYAVDPAAMQYFGLSSEVQWPMDIWNRAPLQVFLNLGLTFEVAQAMSISICLLLLAASVLLLRHVKVSFSTAFALAYILLLIGRPITWSMPMLAIFTLTAAWPALSRSRQLTLAATAIAIGASHWIAFVSFAAGIWPGLLSVQTPSFPWETLAVLPGAWAVVVLTARRGELAARR